MTTEGYNTADHIEAAISSGASPKAVNLMAQVIKNLGGCDESSYFILMQNLAIATTYDNVAGVEYAKSLGVSEEAAHVASARFGNEEPKTTDSCKAFKAIATYANSIQNRTFQSRLKQSASVADLPSH